MTARKKKDAGEEGQGVPLWIVSFTDMITLLLAFFVLLQAFAHVRDPELFYKGQGSFLSAIRSFGLPQWLLGRENRQRRQYTTVKHTTKEAKDKIPRNKVLDAEDESIREVFQQLRKVVETQSTDMPDVAVESTGTPVRFASGKADLDAAAKEWLTRFALDLKTSRTPKGTRINVVGLAPDVDGARAQWLLSAVRAQRVADFLAGALGGGLRTNAWEIASCGAGPGGELCRRLGGTARRSFVVIAVEGAKGQHGR